MAHSFDTDTEAAGLCAFVDASPPPSRLLCLVPSGQTVSIGLA